MMKTRDHGEEGARPLLINSHHKSQDESKGCLQLSSLCETVQELRLPLPSVLSVLLSTQGSWSLSADLFYEWYSGGTAQVYPAFYQSLSPSGRACTAFYLVFRSHAGMKTSANSAWRQQSLQRACESLNAFNADTSHSDSTSHSARREACARSPWLTPRRADVSSSSFYRYVSSMGGGAAI